MLTSQQITEVKNIAIGFPFYRHNVILEKHFRNKKESIIQVYLWQVLRVQIFTKPRVRLYLQREKYDNGFPIYQYYTTKVQNIPALTHA